MIVDDEDKTGARLFHLAEDASGNRGVVAIPTTPPLHMAGVSTDQVVTFPYCSIAVAREGTIFLWTRSQLWTISPPP